jgi:hypothetical protein
MALFIVDYDSDFLDAHLGNAHADDDAFSVSPDYEYGHVADSADLFSEHGMDAHDHTFGVDHDAITQSSHSGLLGRMEEDQ